MVEEEKKISVKSNSGHIPGIETRESKARSGESWEGGKGELEYSKGRHSGRPQRPGV